MPRLAAALADVLGAVRRPGDFYAAGTAELLAPSLDIEGVGPVALPLLPEQAARLIAAAEPAPFGRGQDTVLDPAVRRCRQIGPDRVRIGGRHWARTLDAIVARAAEGLGVAEPVAAEFYKLLIYEPGGFFVGHRDTEKAPGMFATLVIALPSPHAGGALLVRHGGREARLDARPDDPAEVVFAAFYADCVHEVLPVTDGHRLTLVYNLVRRGRGRPPEPPDHRAEQAHAAALLRGWASRRTRDAPVKLVRPLEHAYTPAELGFPALKGADAAVAGVLAAVAPEAGCEVHLALLTIEETGPAEYKDSHDWRRGDRDDEDAFEVVEVGDRVVGLSDWRNPDGAAPALGTIPVDEAEELSPPGACDDLDPDEEEFREATGNEGASFERTYRRAALVLWPTGGLPAVLSQAGLPVTLPYLEDLARRWSEGDRVSDAPVRREAQDLAAAMIARWPTGDWYPRGGGGGGGGEGASDVARMLAALARLDDVALIGRFLTEITAAGFYEARDNGAILDALGHVPPPRRAALVERVVRGAAGAAFGACAGLLAGAAQAWGLAGLRRAASALVDAMPGDPARVAPSDTWRKPARIEPGTVVALLAGLGATDPAQAERAVDRLLARPQTYGMDAVLVPTAKRLPADVPAAGRLRAACLAHLRARVAEPLAPPTDWRRASKLPCRCPLCTDLARFLDNSGRETWTLKATAPDRDHVEDTIKRAECDLDTATDKRGRPYTLVCTKNRASHERRARQREQDLADVAVLGG